MFTYLIAARSLQALDLGRYSSFLISGVYEQAPSTLWEHYNPRGSVERYFSGLRIARILGVRSSPESTLYDESSSTYEELFERCAHWYNHFSLHDTIYGIEEEPNSVLPWENFLAVRNGSVASGLRPIATNSKWTLRSIFPKVDESLVLDYEGVVGVKSRALGFDFKAPQSAQLSFPFMYEG